MNRRRFLAIMGSALAAAGIPAAAGAMGARAAEAEPRRLRITVLRRECFADIQSRYLADPETGPCSCFHTGATYTCSTAQMPVGFCPRAWKAITGALGEAAGGTAGCAAHSQGQSLIASCGDGTRPVIFKLENL